jgi:Spy/CpxP family protein refolding chaperone
MKRTLIAALILTTTIAATASPRQRRPSPERMRERVADVLSLTDAQKSQAESLRLTMRATIEPLRAQLRNNREAVKTAVDAGNAQQAGQLLVANKSVREQIKAAHESFQTQFAAILTAEQKAKWSVLQELRESRRDQRQHERD